MIVQRHFSACNLCNFKNLNQRLCSLVVVVVVVVVVFVVVVVVVVVLVVLVLVLVLVVLLLPTNVSFRKTDRCAVITLQVTQLGVRNYFHCFYFIAGIFQITGFLYTAFNADFVLGYDRVSKPR
jgi:hypothetical protein